MAGKFYESVGHRSGVIGLPDANGASYQADVDASGNLRVSQQISVGGVLNATGQVSIANTATLIIAADTRQGILVTNPSTSVTVYIGGSGVTISNGQALLPGCSLSLPIVSAIYGIVASGSQTISYIEVI